MSGCVKLKAVELLERMQVPYHVPRGPKHHSRAISAIFRAAAKPALLIIMNYGNCLNEFCQSVLPMYKGIIMELCSHAARGLNYGFLVYIGYTVPQNKTLLKIDAEYFMSGRHSVLCQLAPGGTTEAPMPRKSEPA